MSRPPTLRPAVPPAPPARGLWRTTPPAIFPPILGLFALGLGWRRAAPALPEAAGALGEAILGATALLWAFATLAYLAKVARRPGVVAAELGTLPGRAGIAAAILGLYALAAALAPYAGGPARGLIAGGLVLHAALALAVARALATGPAEARTVTPVLHLVFAGPVVAALAAVPAGWPGLAGAILWPALAAAAAVWAASALQLARRVPPAPLRPLLAIHAAPAAVGAMVAADLGLAAPAVALAALAAALAGAVAAALRWIAAAGFSALWGAFTFPLAALAGAVLAQGWAVAGLLLLAGATVANPAIAARVLRGWADGSLAARTNAAVA